MKKNFRNCKNFIRNWIFRIPIRNLVAALLIFLVMISTLVIASCSYNLSRKNIEKKTSVYCIDILNEISTNICTELQEIDSLSTYICYSKTIQAQLNRLNQSSQTGYYTEKGILEKEIINMTVANSSMKEITLLTKNGQSAWISRPTPSFSSDSPILQILSDHNGSLCWTTEFSSNKDLSIIAGRLIYDLGTQKELAYFLTKFDNEILTNILKQKKFFQEGLLFIIDGTGTIISSNRKDNIGDNWTCPPDLAETSYNYKQKSTQEWITLCTIPQSDWKLISIIPSIVYEKEIINLRKYIFLIAFITIAVGIFISLYITQKLFVPLNKLSQFMHSVGKGNFNVTKPYYYRNDIGILYDHFINMVNEIQLLINKTEKQQTLLQKAELNSLRMQINPHFIYNTLESIKWIAYMNHNQDIVIMVKALGDFMRSNISGPEFITIEKELENINCYLTIQKLRYHDKFEITFNIVSEILHAQVPKLLLQPLVENSIVHGLEPKNGIGRIEICGTKQENDILITITDNGIGFSQEALKNLNNNLSSPADTQKSGGLGIKNVHQRIQMYYGEAYGLVISSSYGLETQIYIRIPYSESLQT